MKLSYEKEYRHCLENSNKRELVDKIIYDEKIFIKKDKDIKELHNKIDKAIDFIDIYTNGINLEAFDCLNLMYRIKKILKEGDKNE